MRVHITGASGARVSTLGVAVAEKLGVPVFDADNFYWLTTTPPFSEKRDKGERLEMALSALAGSKDAVFSGSCLDWGTTLEDSFDLVVFLYLDAETRITRLTQRELERRGTVSEQFLNWAAQYDAGTASGRSLERHRAWLGARACPVLELHGDLSVDERVSRVLSVLRATGDEGTKRCWD